MSQMRLRQQELEARNGVLEYTCTLATKHILELNEDPVSTSPLSCSLESNSPASAFCPRSQKAHSEISCTCEAQGCLTNIRRLCFLGQNRFACIQKRCLCHQTVIYRKGNCSCLRIGYTMQEAYDLQQEMILRDTAKVWRRMNPNVSVKDLKEQKVGFYIAEVFPVRNSFKNAGHAHIIPLFSASLLKLEAAMEG